MSLLTTVPASLGNVNVARMLQRQRGVRLNSSGAIGGMGGRSIHKYTIAREVWYLFSNTIAKIGNTQVLQ